MDTIDGDLRVKGQLIASSMSLTEASFGDSDVEENAGVEASKLQHQHAIGYRQTTGADVATQTQDVHIVYGATGEVLDVNIACTTAPVGTGTPSTDKKFTIDIQKGNQTTAFATLLSAVATIDNTIAARQVVEASLVAMPTLAAGDILRVIVTASGSTGTQGQGLVVTITTREDAQ